jgi:hypothetical protein
MTFRKPKPGSKPTNRGAKRSRIISIEGPIHSTSFPTSAFQQSEVINDWVLKHLTQ